MLRATQQSFKVLGFPIGHEAFVQRFLENKTTEQQVLFQRIPWVTDPQSAYLLLFMCGSTKDNFWLRALRPEDTESFARRHDENVWTCLPSSDSWHAECLATLALSAGRLGLGSAVRVRPAAHMPSWDDSFRTVRQRHPAVAERTIDGLEANVPLTCFKSVRQCKQVFLDAGLEMPPWQELADSSPPRQEEPEPTQPQVGWQQRASRKLEEKFLREQLWPGLSDSSRALLRSQHGPLASAPLTALPTSKAARVDPNPSMSSCADVCTCPSLCPCVPADVAANLTNLANIVQRALWQGCWGEGATRWMAQVCREAGVRMDLGRVQQLGRTASGGCRRRFHFMARCAARHRHDLGLTSPS